MLSKHHGWRFCFDKELRKLADVTGYLPAIGEASEMAESCIMFMLNQDDSGGKGKRWG